MRKAGKRHEWIFVSVLTAGLVLVALAAWSGSAGEPVRWIPDGDTLMLASGTSFRVMGIDAPETSHDGKPVQYHAGRSRDLLRDMVGSGRVVVHRKGAVRDRFGRTVARVLAADGRDLSLAMVEAGAAFCYPHSGRSGADPKLLAAQKRAMRVGKGFWPRVLKASGSVRYWVGNRGSARFHRPACRFGKKVSSRNRIRFDSLRAAFEAGYAPCRSCTPWPEEH